MGGGRPMRRRAGVPVAGLLLAAGLAGCGGDNWAARCTTDAAEVISCAPAQRPPARRVTGDLLDGGTYDVTQDRGRVVVVNFWGSWCPPCRAEAADLERAYQATKADGVAFVGVDTRDGRDAARAFVRGRTTYPNLYDPDGEVALAFEVTQVSTPSTLILDRQGRTAVGLRRATTAAELQSLVERVAAEATG
jgi:thiol-disulfide isomerase/thioredoxin